MIWIVCPLCTLIFLIKNPNRLIFPYLHMENTTLSSLHCIPMMILRSSSELRERLKTFYSLTHILKKICGLGREKQRSLGMEVRFRVSSTQITCCIDTIFLGTNKSPSPSRMQTFHPSIQTIFSQLFPISEVVK